MAENPLFGGSEYVEDVFRDADDPLEAIASLQQENSVRVAAMQPSLPMLDLHGVTRTDVYGGLYQVLLDRLLDQVGKMDARGLHRLLDKSFSCVEVEGLRPVSMRILQTLPAAGEDHLRRISESPELYASCPAGLKRQIWESNQGLFGEAVSPLLDQYTAEKESLMFATHSPGENKKPQSFFSVAPKARRQSSVVQQLVDMVGPSLPLYNTLLQFLRTLFLRTRISHYCTLRADVLMVLHERESPICSSDPCHKFAWCLDACIRAGQVDSKKARELYSFLENLASRDEVLGDVAMLLRDPYALNTISQSILKCLLDLQRQWSLPRDSDELHSLLRLQQLGLKSLHILETKDYYESPLDVDLIVKFLPEMMSLMVGTSLYLLCHKLKEEFSPHRLSPPFLSSLRSSPPALCIACCYALHLLEKREHSLSCLLLQGISSSYVSGGQDMELPDAFLHLLVLVLTSGSSSDSGFGSAELIRESSLESIIREFWLPSCLNSEPVLLHLCRLMWVVHARLDRTFLQSVLEEMQPGSQLSTVAHDQYQTLVSHINSASNSQPS